MFYTPKIRDVPSTRSRFFIPFLIIFLPLSFGCGWIADKDRIVVARIGEDTITRGDIDRILRNMPDDERPIIQNKWDLQRMLNRYLDDRLKDQIAEELVAENKISVSRDAARANYLADNPENARVYDIQDPAQLGMTPQDIAAFKAEIEFGIDDVEKEMRREAAMQYLLREGVESGTLFVTPEEFEEEFALRERELINLEAIDFIAIRFPIEIPDAVMRAGEIRRMIDSGTPFEEIAAAVQKQNPNLVFESTFENNPGMPQFRTFWDAAHGAQEGAVLGPIFLPQHDLIGRDAQGQARVIQQPGAQLVLKVLDHRSERPKTLEEAKPELASGILYRKLLNRLRRDNRVEIYEDQLPDPGGIGGQYRGQMIDTGLPQQP